MLRQLQTSSTTALTQYTRTINKTRELLNDSVLEPLSPAQRSALLEHFRKETRAYDKYMRERRKLWFALIASESSTLND